jgi:PAS domain S-box-containing protein
LPFRPPTIRRWLLSAVLAALAGTEAFRLALSVGWVPAPAVLGGGEPSPDGRPRGRAEPWQVALTGLTAVVLAAAAVGTVLTRWRVLEDWRDRQREADDHRRTLERLRLMESVVLNAHDAVVITEAEPLEEPGPRIVFVNRTFLEMGGWEEAEVLGRSPRIFQSSRTDRGDLARIRAALSNREAIRIELLNRRRDGSDLWVEANIFPIRDDSGRCTHFAAVQRDIGGRKAAERALRESEARFRGVVEDQTELICRCRPDGTLTFLNGAMCRFFGVREEDLLGRRWPDLVPEAERPARTAFIATLTPSNPVNAREERYPGPDGRDRHVRWVTRATFDAEGRLENYQSVGRDVSELRELQAQFLQAQKMEAIGRLAGGVAHDFNGLIMAIMIYAGTVARRLPDGSPMKADVAEIQRAAERAAALTRQLLAFCRKSVLQPETLDVREVAADSARMLRRLLGENIELVLAPSAVPAVVHADRCRLEQVFTNLAVNARDAMPSGGRLTLRCGPVRVASPRTLRRGRLPAGEWVALSVADTGIGMDEATLGRLFEPFFTTKPPGVGTGLGLATCAGIVEQSGGYVDVFSRPGQGSEFTIYLPAVAASASSSVSGNSNGAGTGTGEGSSAAGEGTAGRLATPSGYGSKATWPRWAPAAAASSPPPAAMSPASAAPALPTATGGLVRSAIVTILRGAGFRVLEAGRPSEAIRLAEDVSGQIELVLTDLVLPEMDGHDLAGRIAGLRPGARFVFMSGHPDDVFAKAGPVPPEQFLSKPFRADALLARVRQALGGPGPAVPATPSVAP